jgi:hypothetical protein
MEERATAHETLVRSAADKVPSERSFGIVFTVVLALVGLWPLFSRAHPRYSFLLAAAVLLAVSFLAPQALRYPNRLWHRFGLLLNRIVSPLVLGLIFFTTIVPTAVLMKLAGRDPLRLKRDSDASTYWIERSPPGPDSKSMNAQF